MRHRLAIVGLVASLTLFTSLPRPAAAQICNGDCDGDHRVQIDELIRAINIVLGNATLSACPGFDGAGCGGDVCIAELVAVVNNALIGCPVVTLPQLAASSPADGATGVARTAWIRLEFAAPLSAAASDGLRLTCAGTDVAFRVDQLDERVLLLNPLDDLPAGACRVAVAGGARLLDFEVAAAGAPATVLYDRTDARRTSPFPDDYWTTTDPATHATRKLAIPLPEGPADLQQIFGGLLPQANELDGFSPIAHFVVELSDAPDQATLPHTSAESLDPLATVVLLDVTRDAPTYGQRVPFGLQARTDTGFDGTVTHSVLIFPSIPLEERHRYGLVITRRVLVDAGRPFDPSAAFSGNLRAQSLAAEVKHAFPRLAVPLDDGDVALTLAITIRSLDVIAADVLAMKDQVLAAPPPGFTIVSVDPQPAGGDVAAIVHGMWEAPDWRDGRYLARDDSGRPRQTRTKAIPFTLALPRAALDGPVPIAMYQHGNPGSAEAEVPSAARRSLAAAGFAVVGFTDVLNRELSAGIVDEQQAILAQVAPVLTGIVEDHAVPDFWMETRGEMLAFLRLFDGLGALDVLPVGAPDGVPDLDVGAARVYLGISEGGNNGQGFLPYAPEIKAGAIVAGGARLGEVLIHQSADLLLSVLGALFQSLTPTDLWVGVSLFQTIYDRQDPHNHARFLYRDRLEVGGTTRKPSVLVLEGLNDTLVPNHATESLAWTAGPLPLLAPVQRAVPFLQVVDGPIAANIDAETSAAFYQYVPAGVPGIATTPGCEAQPEGHYCAQTAPASLRQRVVFFQSALQGVPTIIDPFTDSSGPTLAPAANELLVR